MEEAALHFFNQPTHSTKQKENNFLFIWFHSLIAKEMNGIELKDIITVARLKLTAGMI